MKLPEIIGISGTNGSGKDTLANLRLETQGARVVSLSDILRTEAAHRNVEPVRENLIEISTEWARKFGAGALSLKTIQNYYETRTDDETGLSIVSVRRPTEAVVIQSFGGKVSWVDACRQLRYARVSSGQRNRAEDTEPYEEFCAKEDREMNPLEPNDPTQINLAGVRAIADIHIENNFDTQALYEAYLRDEFEL